MTVFIGIERCSKVGGALQSAHGGPINTLIPSKVIYHWLNLE